MLLLSHLVGSRLHSTLAHKVIMHNVILNTVGKNSWTGFWCMISRDLGDAYAFYYIFTAHTPHWDDVLIGGVPAEGHHVVRTDHL